jgi:quercetin dioxygenase-like cupin family protein
MFKHGEIYENPVTTVRATIQVGTHETNGRRLVADLDVRKCGAGPSLHTHPTIHERLTVTHGRIAVALNGKTSIAEVGSTIDIPPGVPHRWWNAGIYEAHLVLEIEPAARFEEYLRNLFGLAQDGKTDPMGTPHFLQLAALLKEFSDVIRFEKPAGLFPAALVPALAPVARLFGYRGSYSEYLTRPPSRTVPPAPLSSENYPQWGRHAV